MRKVTITLLTLVGLALAFGLAGGGASTFMWAVKAQQGTAAPGSIDEMVQQALASGESIVTTPMMVTHDDVEGFDEAHANLTAAAGAAATPTRTRGGTRRPVTTSGTRWITTTATTAAATRSPSTT